MTDKEMLETAAKNAAYIVELEAEIDQLKKVVTLTDQECLAGGYCLGLAHRIHPHIMDDMDRRMVQITGKCIARIINHQPPEEK